MGPGAEKTQELTRTKKRMYTRGNMVRGLRQDTECGPEGNTGNEWLVGGRAKDSTPSGATSTATVATSVAVRAGVGILMAVNVM